MKILFLSHSPDNPNGGASRIYHLLTDGLQDRGHSVTTFHFEDFRPPQPKLPRLLVQRLAMPQWMSYRTSGLDLLSFDIIMSSSGMAYPIFKRLSSKTKRPVLVSHSHGNPVYDYGSNLAEHFLGHWRVSLPFRIISGPIQIKWHLQGLRWSDLAIVQNLRDLGEAQDASNKKTVLIPAAIHPQLLDASKEIQPLPDRDPSKILWFGTWEGRKGAHYVPAAFRRVREKRPDATLALGGTGKSPEYLLNQFDPADRGSIEVLPRISVSEQIRLFQTFSIFLFPSLTEGFGLALPEAMSFGLAAVTTQAAFGGDHLQDGKNALVVYPSAPHLARAMLELIENSTLRWRLANEGRDLARTFTVDKMVSAYEETFAESIRLSETQLAETRK